MDKDNDLKLEEMVDKEKLGVTKYEVLKYGGKKAMKKAMINYIGLPIIDIFPSFFTSKLYKRWKLSGKEIETLAVISSIGETMIGSVYFFTSPPINLTAMYFAVEGVIRLLQNEANLFSYNTRYNTLGTLMLELPTRTCQAVWGRMKQEALKEKYHPSAENNYRSGGIGNNM